ncbi:MAG TPA: VOC family protein, partial [Desertimonas sp.]|nr:VOC family protein [Desertimonas sp.]
MQLLDGINHVAVLTDDLRRFIDFYRSVFEVDVLFEEATPAFRHAILRTGPRSWLHPVEVSGNPHGAALPRMFDRGHLDHVALTAESA